MPNSSTAHRLSDTKKKIYPLNVMCKQMRHFAKKFKGKLAYPEQIIQGNGQKKIVPMHILKGCKIKLGLFKS